MGAIRNVSNIILPPGVVRSSSSSEGRPRTNQVLINPRPQGANTPITTGNSNVNPSDTVVVVTNPYNLPPNRIITPDPPPNNNTGGGSSFIPDAFTPGVLVSPKKINKKVLIGLSALAIIGIYFATKKTNH